MGRRGAGGLPIRERRHQAVGAYHGSIAALADALSRREAPQRIRTFSQTKWDEVVSALELLHGIGDAAVVVHGPAGCAAVGQYLDLVDGPGALLVSTALDERDSIMGADAVLADAVRTAHAATGAPVVFVLTTPVTAINNDDVDSVVLDVGEELGIEVVPIRTDGFKSKIGGNGFDLVFQALDGLLPAAVGADADLVNVLATLEHPDDVTFLAEAVRALGRTPNVLPRAGTLGSVRRSAHASVSLAARSESRHLGELLQRERGVRFAFPLPPIGAAGTSRWLREVAVALGVTDHGVRLAEDLDATHAALVETARHDLDGVRVYLSGEPAVALGLAELVLEFGGEVVGLSVFDLDERTGDLLAERYRAHGWTFDLHVGEGQPFEQVNIVSRLRPDVYLGGLGQGPPVARHGVPAVSYASLPLFGHAAAARLARRLRRAVDADPLSRRGRGAAYRDVWLSKSPHWYIKQEVR